MLSIIAGVVLVIIGVILWLGNISVGHALAIFIGIIGIFILLAGTIPERYRRL